MLSNSVELRFKEIQTSSAQKRPLSSYPKKNESKKRITPEVETDVLNALKNLIQQHTPAPIQNTFLSEEATPSIERISSSSQVGRFYDKMCTLLLETHENGLSETSFFLVGDEYTSSLFYGSKITIIEQTDTAPKVYNIQFSASPETLALFEKHATALLSAFKSEEFNFSVHRIDTHLTTENDHRLIKRVEQELEKE